MKEKPSAARAPKPFCIGLLGGVASGKSTVARELEELGGTALDADRYAREAAQTPAVEAAIRAKLGREIEAADGSLDRQKIAALVFADAALRRWLESLIHPLVRERIEAGIEEARANGKRFVVLDVPLLAEGGLIDRCDTTLFVAAPAEQRETRARKERGWAPGEISRREANQSPVDEKRKIAKHVIENSGSLEELREKVRVWLDSVLKR